MPRPRVHLVLALGLTIAAGLASRHWPLPGVLAEHTGDALYAVAAYLAMAMVAPGVAGWRLAVTAAVTCYAIEAAQALDWPWLVALRATRPGRLFLGVGFSVADLVSYTVGAAGAFALDLAMSRWRAGETA